MTASEQKALTLLQQTTIPRRIFALSFQEDEAPTTCLVVPVQGESDQFQLFVTWKPNTVIVSKLPRSVILATMSSTSASEDTFTETTYKTRFGHPVQLSPRVLAAFDRASLDPAAVQCLVLNDGDIKLAATPK